MSPRGLPQLVRHALLLTALLAGVAVVVGTRSSFITDEAYVQIQLDTIEDTGGWTLPHPLPEVDPESDAFPLHGATEYEDGFTLYGKHPALIYLYRPVHAAFGAAGLIGLSILGTVGAALAAGLLAERLRSGSAVLALWLVGGASPLFFDAFVIHGHTLAAATAGLAALAALRLLERPHPVVAVAAVVAALATALLRTEGILFAAALGAALALTGATRRRLAPVVTGALVAAAGAAAHQIDEVWSGAVADSPLVGGVPAARSGVGWFQARVSGLATTLFLPGYRGVTVAEAVTFVGAVLLVLGVVLVHRRPQDPGARAIPAVGAALLVVRALLPWGAVPGLLVAGCVLVAGLVLLRPGHAGPGAVVLLVTVALYAAAVAVTQYESGGHTEWGGRYFALGVPLLGALAAGALLDAWASWSPDRARLVQAGLAGAAAGLAVLAVTTLRGAHDRNRDRTDRVLEAAAELGTAADGGRPVVVSEDDQVPRLARGRYDDVRFLLVRPRDMERYLERLAAAGFDELLVVSIDPAATLERLGPFEPAGEVEPQPLQWEDGGGLLRVEAR